MEQPPAAHAEGSNDPAAAACAQPVVVDWQQRFSREGRRMRMPSMQGMVAKCAVPGLIPLHGGLPPSDAFPLTSMVFGLAQPAAPAAANGSAPQQQQQQQQQLSSLEDGVLQQLRITDPATVAAAQQYMFQPKGYAPLAAWARQLVLRLHQPATAAPASPVGLDVVVTPGASAALDALARVLLNPGDPVLCEEFSYSHHIDAHLLTRGCEVLPVRMDGEGVMPSHLDALLTQRRAAGLKMPRVLYTIPTGQNPTGATMSVARIGAVYALARKWDLAIIEDDAYYWLQYPDGPGDVPGLGRLKPGFLSVDTDGRVVRLDTFAKLLGPGYRLGWVSGPPAIVNALALHGAAVSVGACSLSQVVLHQLLEAWGEAGFDDFVRQLQRKYATQALAAEAAAWQHLADVAEWQPVSAGMFMWMRLKDGGDTSFLLHAGAEHRVMVVPGFLTSAAHLQALAREHYQQQEQQSASSSSSVSVQPEQAEQQQQQQAEAESLPPCPFFRVSFASVGEADMAEGFARLRRAIEQQRQVQQQQAPAL